MVGLPQKISLLPDQQARIFESFVQAEQRADSLHQQDQDDGNPFTHNCDPEPFADASVIVAAAIVVVVAATTAAVRPRSAVVVIAVIIAVVIVAVGIAQEPFAAVPP